MMARFKFAGSGGCRALGASCALALALAPFPQYSRAAEVCAPCAALVVAQAGDANSASGRREGTPDWLKQSVTPKDPTPRPSPSSRTKSTSKSGAGPAMPPESVTTESKPVVKSIAAGLTNTAVLYESGILKLLGQVVTTDKSGAHLDQGNFIAVASGSAGAVAINAEGHAVVFPADANSPLGPCMILTQPSAVVAASVGGAHALLLTRRGEVYAWGINSDGQVGDGSTTKWSTPVHVSSGIAAIAAGGRHSLALSVDGTLYAWGNNRYGQLGTDGPPASVLSPVGVISGIKEISAGAFHSLVVSSNREVFAFGRNEYGQLGDGTQTDRRMPVRVLLDHPVMAISAGDTHSIALDDKGSLYAWGGNDEGQIQRGEYQVVRAPMLLRSTEHFQAASAGGLHTFVLLRNGDMLGWGNTQYAQIGN